MAGETLKKHSRSSYPTLVQGNHMIRPLRGQVTKGDFPRICPVFLLRLASQKCAVAEKTAEFSNRSAKVLLQASQKNRAR